MRSVLRAATVVLCLAFTLSCAIAKDVDAKHAERALDRVFSKSDPKLREKELAKLDGDTLDAAGAAAARTHALELQRTPPRKLPKLEEAFEGALNYEYEVRTRKTSYKTFALLDLPGGLSKDTPAPLLIGLHSELGTAWRELSGLRSCERYAPELRNCIIACPNALNRGQTSEDPRKNPPGIHEYFGWGPKREGIDTVFNLLDKLLAEYNIDRDRIFIEGGPGMGGEAAFHLTMLRPSQFAAVCVRDSLPPHYYTDLDREADLDALRKAGTLGEQKVVFPWLECFKNTPVFWVHGDKDRKYPTAHAHQARDAMKAAGVPLTYYEYEGGHAMGSTATIAKAVQACIKCKRYPLPVSITSRGVRDDKASLGNGRNYWVEITKESYQGKRGDWPYKIFAGGKVTVAANREENSLTITSDNVKEIRVYLTDELLYLDKPIKLVVNGKESTVNATRELKVLAETASSFAGSGESYSAVLDIKT